MAEHEDRSVSDPPIELRVRFVKNVAVRTAYATNMMVQSTDNEFILTFFEASPPLIVGNTPDERRAAAAQIEAVDAIEVARVVIAPGRMQNFIDLLKQQVERKSNTPFEATQAKERTTR
jgi:hypothetical protein